MSLWVSPKVNWSINAISCEGTLPYFNMSASGYFDISSILPRNCTDELSDSNAMCKEWMYEDNVPLIMKNDEKLSLLGALGLCRNYTNNSLRAVNRLTRRLMNNFSSKFDSITFDNIITHHSSEIVKHRMRNGNLIFPMLLGDLETGIFDNCPYNIIKDHI